MSRRLALPADVQWVSRERTDVSGCRGARHLLRTVSGETADLGLVGEPESTDASLLGDLTGIGYIPVIASVGVDADGVLLNVNADVLAAHIAAILPAKRLIIAGGTAGVLDADGQTIRGSAGGRRSTR